MLMYLGLKLLFFCFRSKYLIENCLTVAGIRKNTISCVNFQLILMQKKAILQLSDRNQTCALGYGIFEVFPKKMLRFNL